MVRTPSLLLIGKKDDFYYEQTIEFVKTHFEAYQIFMWKRGDPFPDEINRWRGDYIISYLLPWITPESVLKKANKACTNFAIYNKENIFGVSCHHMGPRFGTGRMVAERRFPLYKTDTVFFLTQRCYAYILQLFYEVVAPLLTGGIFAISEGF